MTVLSVKMLFKRSRARFSV